MNHHQALPESHLHPTAQCTVLRKVHGTVVYVRITSVHARSPMQLTEHSAQPCESLQVLISPCITAQWFIPHSWPLHSGVSFTGSYHSGIPVYSPPNITAQCPFFILKKKKVFAGHCFWWLDMISWCSTTVPIVSNCNHFARSADFYV